MASLKECRKALAAAITDATDLRGYWYVPTAPALPCFVVRPAADEPLTFGRAVATYSLEVLLLSSSNRDEAAQEWLDDALMHFGPTGTRGAVFLSPTLGTAATELPAAADAEMTAVADGFRSYQLTSFDGGETSHWSAVVPVRVTTRGDR